MEIRIKKRIGDSELQFRIDEKNDIDALTKAGSLTSMPNQCGLCKSDKVYLSSNKTKDGYTFIKIVCRECTAASTLGQYKTGGFFWKQWEKWSPDNKRHENEYIEKLTAGDIELFK